MKITRGKRHRNGGPRAVTPSSMLWCTFLQYRGFVNMLKSNIL